MCLLLKNWKMKRGNFFNAISVNIILSNNENELHNEKYLCIIYSFASFKRFVVIYNANDFM